MADGSSLSEQVDRLAICFVIATVQVETAAKLLQVRTVVSTTSLIMLDATSATKSVDVCVA